MTALYLSVVLIACQAAPADGLRQAAVFTAGQDGYHTYRIPSLLVTVRGTLLAFCEGRKYGRGDAGDIDLILRRSFDGGQTWQATQIIWDDGPNTCGNPCSVIDRRTGAIWLLMTHNLGLDKEDEIIAAKSKGARTVWICKSTDDGASWTNPIEITRHVKEPNWTWFATGPGTGIQLKSGRLVVPCDNIVAGSRVMQSHVIYSDDGGASWKTGGVVGPKCNESQVVELADGSLTLNMRSYRGRNQRLVATSKDGGITWSSLREDPALIEPVCQASIVRHPANGGRVLFSNPAGTRREKMTIRMSRDEGKTWPVARLLHHGPAAYSSLAVLLDDTVGCIYERGDQHPYETITFAQFPLAWLEEE